MTDIQETTSGWTTQQGKSDPSNPESGDSNAVEGAEPDQVEGAAPDGGSEAVGAISAPEAGGSATDKILATGGRRTLSRNRGGEPKASTTGNGSTAAETLKRAPGRESKVNGDSPVSEGPLRSGDALDVEPAATATSAIENGSPSGTRAEQAGEVQGSDSASANGLDTETAPDGVIAPETEDLEPGIEAPEGDQHDGLGLIRYGAREIGTGTGMLARSGWRKTRAKLPGAQTPRGLAAWLVAAVVIIVAVIVVAAGALSKTPTVVVATAGPATVNAKPGGVGTTAAAQNLSFAVGLNIVGLTAPVTVTQVNVINGSTVHKGQALLGLDPTTLEDNVANVQTQLTFAQLALNSEEASKGSATLYPIASLQAEVAIDQQLLAIAKGNSNSIVAPISGSVTNIAVQPGQVVRPGTTMLQIVDTSRIDVTAGLQLSDMQAVRVGQPADVVPTGLVGVHLPGTVVAINPTATGGGLQGSVVIETNNVSANPLPIGTQVFVRITATRHAAVTVPTIAVQNLDLAPAVFVVSDGHVRVTPVTVGAVDSNRAQILSGLSPGEVVAESNTQLLTNGEHVNVAR